MGDAQYLKVNGQWRMLSKEQVIDQKYKECSDSVWNIINQDGYIGAWPKSVKTSSVHKGWKIFGICSGALVGLLCMWTILVAINVIPSEEEFWQMVKYGFKWIIIMVQIASGIACPVEQFVI